MKNATASTKKEPDWYRVTAKSLAERKVNTKIYLHSSPLEWAFGN